MALDEMRLRGWAEIASVEPCPVIEEGAGRIVTGTFRHESRELRRIGLSEFTVTGALSLVQGPDRPGAISSVLEPTGGHPIYSLTRQDWVPARDLSVGELVETRNGPALVASNEAQPGSRTVFNLEVEGSHEYFAGDGAVRSHNGCVKGAPKVTPPANKVPTPGNRFPQDARVNPNPPPALDLDRPIGLSPTQNAAAQSKISALESDGFTNIRVNQQQVNGQGQRVGTNRPDIQATGPDGTRHYFEYDRSTSNRGPFHEARISANDPNGEVHLYKVD